MVGRDVATPHPDDEADRPAGAETAQPRGQLWLIPREGTPGTHIVADVAIALRTSRLYTYSIPDNLRDQVGAGVSVRVPYGRSERLVDGICVRVAEREWNHTRRPISEVVPGQPLLDERLVELGLWISEYYACPPGLALNAMFPSATRKPRLRRVVYARLAGPVPDDLTPKRQALCDALRDAPEDALVPRSELLAAAGVGSGVLKALCDAGIVELVTRHEPLVPELRLDGVCGRGAAEHADEDDLHLTAGQQGALDAILKAALPRGAFGVHLVFGVPGSGKTEVYVRAIRDVVAAGRQAILIVPEIALATQVVERLARRFDRVAVLHSQLTDRRRADTLRAIAAGRVDVVIGTRTAVFAPCRKLGLIVIDEEQETSLKNLAAPFFHARDVAIKRAQFEVVPVVLGTATPALETWYNAHHMPHYHLVHLAERVPGARLPRTRLVRTEPTSPLISDELAHELRATLAGGQQAILLHNRRGYALFLRCERCGLILRCPRCDARLVLHQPRTDTGSRDSRVQCHHCGYRADPPRNCPDSSCHGRMAPTGTAIQQLEEALSHLLPGARIQRLDSDTMKHRDDYASALARFEAREVDLLVGTQMVAKGLDFPAVGLVGVIDADAALWLPDFRAGERVFQLLMQVVGRAGRKTGDSLALVQCGSSDAPAIHEALRMNYAAFAEAELRDRESLYYPPYARLVRVVLLDPRPAAARSAADRLALDLRSLAERVHPQIRVDDAESCTIPRLRDMRRYQVIVRGPRDGSIQRLLREAAAASLLRPKVRRVTVDVDALDLL